MFKLSCKGKGIWDHDGKIFRLETSTEDTGECVLGINYTSVSLCGGMSIALYRGQPRYSRCNVRNMCRMVK